MLLYRFIRDGEVTSLNLHFQTKGDVLELHAHPERSFHDVRIDRGAMSIYGPGRTWEIIGRAGDFIPLTDIQQEHEIIALEDDTLIANVYKGPQPQMEALIKPDWAPYE